MSNNNIRVIRKKVGKRGGAFIALSGISYGISLHPLHARKWFQLFALGKRPKNKTRQGVAGVLPGF